MRWIKLVPTVAIFDPVSCKTQFDGFAAVDHGAARREQHPQAANSLVQIHFQSMRKCGDLLDEVWFRAWSWGVGALGLEIPDDGIYN